MEKYLSLKKDNKHSVIIIKNGLFYNTFGNDAIIISYMTEYKLYYYSNSLCVSFPKSSLNIILSRLRLKNISYIVLDKTNKNTFLGTIDSYINYYKEASIVKQKNYC